MKAKFAILAAAMLCATLCVQAGEIHDSAPIEKEPGEVMQYDGKQYVRVGTGPEKIIVNHAGDRPTIVDSVDGSGRRGSLQWNGCGFGDKKIAAAQPVFVSAHPGGTLFVHYWADLEEPKESEWSNPADLEDVRRQWSRQEEFRGNAGSYTNMFLENGATGQVRLRGEQLTDPDGNLIMPGELHWHPAIPNCGAFMDVLRQDLPEPEDEFWGPLWGVVVTDDYLKDHRCLPITGQSCDSWVDADPLPAEIVARLEKRYGMNAACSKMRHCIDGRYVYGSVQFEGEWKDGPRVEDYPDMKRCLAVDVLADGDKLYVSEAVGYYYDENDFGWNVDDGGEYSGCPIVAAFEGKDGLTLCCYHPSPESFVFALCSQQGDRLVEKFRTVYHSMADEETPVWNKDIAEMERLFVAAEAENAGSKFTRWAHVFVDFANEWIWAQEDGEFPAGAIFLRRDGQLQLVAETGRNRKPAAGSNGDVDYLCISGSAGGPAWYTEVHAFRDGEEVESFSGLEVYGAMDSCTLNGVEIPAAEGKAYLEALPDFRALDPVFNTVE